MARFRKLHFIDDGFHKGAQGLRNHFEGLQGDPVAVPAGRFVWDYWSVKDQYRLLRTPAYHYFPPELYQRFHEELVLWGRNNLGCWDISPPWLSCYVDGSFQEFHRDIPHGTWAYVYSLCPKRLGFLGGETELLRPEVLSLWTAPTPREGYEKSAVLTSITPKFNRLVVFDGRVPHRVRRVEHAPSMVDGRLVIHGWFTQPKTFIDGYHSSQRCVRILDSAFDTVQSLFSEGRAGNAQGTVALELQVSPTGRVRKAQSLTNSLVDGEGYETPALDRWLVQQYSALDFGKARGPTRMVVPLILG